MKKTFYLSMMLLGLLVVGCQPMDDIHDEIDAELNSQLAVGNINKTLTDDDYDEMGLNYPNFNSVDDAKELIPGYLAEQYPTYGAGSQALITFDIYAPKPYPSTVISYEVTTDDYDSYEATEKYNNFDDMDQVYTFLNDKYPNPDNKTLVSLTYKFYDGSVTTRNDGFFYINDEWMFIPGLTDDEYTMMGEGYPDFSSKDEAAQKLPIYAKDKFKYDEVEAGDIKPIMYKYYAGGGVVKSDILYLVYDGTDWSVYSNVVSQTLQFGFENGMWVPDNTIKYTLSSSDYSIIADGLAGNADYETAVNSMERYGNFDRRPGASAYWSDDMVLEAMRVLLNEIDPNAEEGQKYVLTFDIYNGSNTTETISLIKQGGVWVRNN